MSGVDLDDTSRCPAWCSDLCATLSTGARVTEVVHERELLVLDLALRRAANERAEAVVALRRFDEFDADGARTSTGPPVITITAPDDVVGLTPAEALRLGGALIRAARQARTVSGGPR